MDDDSVKSAPNFTGACIVMFGVNLVWMLLLIFAIYGLVAAVFLCLVLNHWMGFLEARRHRDLGRYSAVDDEVHPLSQQR